MLSLLVLITMMATDVIDITPHDRVLMAQGVRFIFTVQAQLRPGLKREKHTPADDRQGAKAKVRRYVFMFSRFIFFSNARGLKEVHELLLMLNSVSFYTRVYYVENQL